MVIPYLRHYPCVMLDDVDRESHGTLHDNWRSKLYPIFTRRPGSICLTLLRSSAPGFVFSKCIAARQKILG